MLFTPIASTIQYILYPKLFGPEPQQSESHISITSHCLNCLIHILAYCLTGHPRIIEPLSITGAVGCLHCVLNPTTVTDVEHQSIANANRTTIHY